MTANLSQTNVGKAEFVKMDLFQSMNTFYFKFLLNSNRDLVLMR